MMNKELEVVAAIIVHEKSVLCVQRGIHRYPYLSEKFEFPGGKTEPGETQEAALIREIREELSLEIQPLRHLISVRHPYPDFAIHLHAWICESKTRDMLLTEHIQALWLKTEDLSRPDWAAADLPVVAELMKSGFGY